MSKESSETIRPGKAPWRGRLHEIIFEADTPMGKAFDVALLLVIFISVLAVMLESVSEIRKDHEHALHVVDWVITVLFTMEYIARIISIKRPRAYVFSFFGMVDLLSILPTYLSLFMSGVHLLSIIRIVRLLRIFRVFKLVRFLGEASQLSHALKASRAKIIVFIGSVSILVVILGTIMFIVEGGENGFTSIPRSIYWAVVTLTTVGYGDIAPHTVLGQGIAAFVMILGYGIIAVPTGIVTAEMTQQGGYKKTSTQVCPYCSAEDHDNDALYCKKCGGKL